MNLKISFISFIIVLIGVVNVNASSPATLYIRQRAEEALRNEMLRSLSDPEPRADVSSCYPIYSERLEKIQKKLDSDVKDCNNAESKKLLEISNEGQQARDVTTKSLKETCDSIDKCSKESENLVFFDCVGKSGDKNTRSIWKASKDSSDIAASIREKIHETQYLCEKCRNSAERIFVVDTTQASDDMMKCYTYGPDGPPTDAPITDAPPTDAPITDVPPTDAPITDAPITDAPITDEPITDAPITDAPPTDAPITDEPPTDAPITDAPPTDAPITDEPPTDAPITDAPPTDAPITDAPITDEPPTDAPITDAPPTDAPITEPPQSLEQDQVEELEQDQGAEQRQTNVRRKLEDFMRSWGKRY